MSTNYLLHEQLDKILMLLMPANRLVCEVQLHTGLRISDVLNLRSDEFKQRMTIIEQKTGKKRKISLKKELFQRIDKQKGRYWVFEGRDWRKHRCRQAVWRDVKRASKACRMPENAGTHSMRKVYAVDLMARYGDIERVRRALNHDRTTTTLLYAMADKLLQQNPRAHGRRAAKDVVR